MALVTTVMPVLAQLEISEWAKIITDIGVLASLVIFFTWTAWKREGRLIKRIAVLESGTQKDLLKCIQKYTDAIGDYTKTIGDLMNSSHVHFMKEQSMKCSPSPSPKVKG